MGNRNNTRHFAFWIIAMVVLLFTETKVQAQSFYIDGPTTVNFGEVKSYSLKDSSHPNGDLWGEYSEVWWGGDVMILNNDYGTEKTVNAIWDMYIEKDIWLSVSFYDGIEYYYVETFVTVLPPTPAVPTVVSSNCNEVVLQRINPPVLTSSYPYGFSVNDVVWYWQSTADGTSTANSASTITLTSGNQYFLRAKSIADYGTDYGTWSAASSSVSYTIGNPAPLVGTITQPTASTSTGSVLLSGLPSSGSWTINPGNITGTGTSTTITGLAASTTYNFTVTTSACTSAPSANVVINAQPTALVAPVLSAVTQPTSATSTGSFTITNYNASYTYSAIPSTGVSFSGAIVTAPPGTYVIIATLGSSSSPSSTSVTINTQPLVCGALSNENYIHTITPTVETTNVVSLSNDQKIETIAYFDGLGRPMQNIGIRAGAKSDGTIVDIITPIEYDAFGRQSKDYLPYAEVSNCGLYRTNAITTTGSFYNTSKYENTLNPYSEKLFEVSPLNRVLKQAAPGNDWALNSGHEIKFDYQANAANEVRLFTALTSWNATSGLYDIVLGNSTGAVFYDANQLYKTITKDENWTSGKNHTTEEFKDKEGRVILKRTYSDYKDINGTTISTETPHDTYYVYDDYGNLTYVLPPKVNTADGVSQTELDELCYQYKYDSRNRLAEKKLPGKGTMTSWEEIVYNKLDQPILTRDPNLRAQNKWLFTKYDAFGRVAYTGLINSSSTRTTMQSNANAISLQYVSKIATAAPIAGTSMNYDNTAYPAVGTTDEIYTINYYDDYGFDLDGGVSETVGTNPSITPSTSTKGLATGGKVRVLGTNSWITNVIYYDYKDRPIYNYSNNNYLGVVQKVKSVLDFVGKPKTTTTTHKRNNVTTSVVDNFGYDPQGRLKTQTQKINSQPEELIVSNEYDELGQLKEKAVGGKTTQSRLQTVDYTYNIRGWLKGINDGDSNNSAITLGSGDLFGFQINYNEGPTDPLKKLYNGNISQTFWKSVNSIDTSLRSYDYSYDALNRLTDAKYSLEDRYNETLSYDRNGDIMNLIRRGNNNVNASTFGTIDNLTYTYDSGNKLMKVIDSQSNTAGLVEEFKDNGSQSDDYAYDTNGNMYRDDNKGITAIAYNHLNLPTSVTMTGVTINYTYDATGLKQRKVVPGITTDYANGYQYENNVLRFFPTAEGYAENNNGTFSYIYQYKDHLGNVRLSYGDKNNDGAITASSEIVEESSYYPFGLKQKVYGEQIVNSSYKYKYNGKELQDELGLNMYDYGARNYDPALGRWMNIDPLAEKYFEATPYNYVLNNPVNAIDPDGMDVYLLTASGRTILALREEGKNTDTMYAVKNSSTADITSPTGTKDNTSLFDMIETNGVTVRRGLIGQLNNARYTDEHGTAYTSIGEQSEENESDYLSIFKYASDNFKKVEFSLEYFTNNGKEYMEFGSYGERQISPGSQADQSKVRKSYHSHSDTIDDIRKERYSMGDRGDNWPYSFPANDFNNSMYYETPYTKYVYFPISKRLYSVTQKSIDYVKKISKSNDFKLKK